MRNLSFVLCAGVLGTFAAGACAPERNIASGADDGEGGSAGNAGGAGGAGSVPVVGEDCTETSDCTNEDETNCAVTCEEVDGEKRCVTRAVDEDGDEHGTVDCAAAPGDDCDDASKNSYPGAPLLYKAGDVGDADYVHWTSEGKAFAFKVDPAAGTYGVVTAQGINGQGVPTGTMTTWSATVDTAATRAAVLTVVEGDGASSVGVLWPATDRSDSNVSYYNYYFSSLTLDVSSAIGGKQASPGTLYGISFSDLSRNGAGWTMAGVSSYYYQTPWVGNGTTYTSFSGDKLQPFGSQVVGSTRLMVGMTDWSYSNASYDPALVIRRYPIGSVTQTGSDLVLIGNSAVTDLAPAVAVGRVDGNFAVAYRDDATGVPLTIRVLNESGATVGSAVTLDGTYAPVALFDRGAKGAILVVDETPNINEHTLSAIQLDNELNQVGKPIALTGVLPRIWKIQLTGNEPGATLLYRDVTPAAGHYQRLGFNRCE